MSFAWALLMIAAQEGAARDVAPPARPPSPRIARIIAGSDGTSPRRAFRIRSVRDEEEILAALGREQRSLGFLMFQRRPYHVSETVDPATGEALRIWFDISAFHGRSW